MKIDGKEVDLKNFMLKWELEKTEKKLRELVKERGLCGDVLRLHTRIVELREKLFLNKSV